MIIVFDLILEEIKEVEKDIYQLESRLLLRSDLMNHIKEISLYSELEQGLTEASIKRFEIVVGSSNKLFNKILDIKEIPIVKKKLLFSYVDAAGFKINIDKWETVIKLRNRTVHHYKEEPVENWISNIRKCISTFKETILLIKENEEKDDKCNR